MSTPLSYLMSLTKTSAKEIAEQTGINVTLLSKFKNGQRKVEKLRIFLNLFTVYLVIARVHDHKNQRCQNTTILRKIIVSLKSHNLPVIF